MKYDIMHNTRVVKEIKRMSNATLQFADILKNLQCILHELCKL